ncbi:nuclear transport factor 2 family protein [soil metagenome]
MTRPLTIGLLVGLLAPAILTAQTPEETAVLAVVTRLFDGMRAADSTMVRSTLHPSVRLVSVGEREGVPALASDPIEGFVAAVGSPHAEIWDERIGAAEVRIDGRLATVWTKYSFFLGEELSHCGVDAFQLFKSEDGWKIFQIADTRRREGCE